MVVASPKASFGLPEATVGLYAAAGGLPRIVHTAGLQIASEIAMTGRRLTPQEVGSIIPFHQFRASLLIKTNYIGSELPPDQ